MHNLYSFIPTVATGCFVTHLQSSSSFSCSNQSHIYLLSLKSDLFCAGVLHSGKVEKSGHNFHISKCRWLQMEWEFAFVVLWPKLPLYPSLRLLSQYQWLKNTQWGRASPTYIKSFLFTLFFCPQAAGAGRSVSQRKRGGQQPSRAAKTGMVMRVQLWLLSAVIIKVKPTKKSIWTVLHTDVAAVCIFQYWYLLFILYKLYYQWADLQKIPNKKIMMVFSDQMWSSPYWNF